MIKNKKIACIIPARLNSTRFPEKMLRSIAGKPILEWVYVSAKSIPFFDEVLVATDSEKIETLVKNFGGQAILTSQNCACGTDRLVEICLSKKIQADIWVNWQGDEPFITQDMIETLLQNIEEDADIWTLKKLITVADQVTNPNFAKVVCDNNNNALYFSRNQIPYYRDDSGQVDLSKQTYFKHVGLYAFTTKALEQISKLTPSFLEDAEKLEQLRFLQNGMKIKVHQTDKEVIGIDLPQDLDRAESFAKTFFK